MPDLVQRVKYIVEVDAADLMKLKTQTDEAKNSFDLLEKQLAKTSKLFATSAARLQAVGKAFEGVKTHADTTKIGLDNVATAVNKLTIELAELRTKSAAAAQGMKALDTEADKVETGSKKRGGAMTFLRGFGVFMAAKHLIVQALEHMHKAAGDMDIQETLGRQLEGYSRILNDARTATQGVVSDMALNKSMALMSSFGIDMNRYAESMELVQKQSIRTGQASAFLTESFARGISRLSPLILDNLGIQVSLKDANETYARSVGKTTEELTKNERITALMNHTLEKLRETTKGVDLQTSVATPLKQLEAWWDDAVNTVAGVAVDIVNEIDFAFSSSSTKFAKYNKDMYSGLELVVSGLRELQDLMGGPKNGVDVLADRLTFMSQLKLKEFTDIAKIFNDAGGSIDPDDPLNIKSSFEAVLEQKAAILKEIKTWIVPQVGGPDSFGPGVLGQQRKKQHEEEQEALDDQVTQLHLAVAMNDHIEQKSAKIRAEVEATIAPYAEFLTKSEQKRLVDEAVLNATKTSLNYIKLVTEQYAEHPAMLLKILTLNAKNTDFMSMIATYARVAAEDLVKQGEGSRKNQAIYNARMVQVGKEVDALERIMALTAGRTPVEYELAQVQTEQGKILGQIRKEQQEYQKEKEDGIATNRLAVIEDLKRQLEFQTREQNFWQIRKEAEEDYFSKWKKANESQRKGEIERLKVYLAQLRALETQNKFMVLLSPAFKSAGDEVAAMIDKLEKFAGSGGGGGSGGRGKGDKPLVWGRDYARVGSLGKFDMGAVQDTMDKQAQDEAALLAQRKLSEEAYSKFENDDLKTLWGPIKAGVGVADAQAELETLKKIRDLKTEYIAQMDEAGLAEYLTQEDQSALNVANERILILEEHLQRLIDLSDGLAQFGAALTQISGGMQGLVGEDVIGVFDGLASSMGQFADAVQKSNNAYGATAAGVQVMRSFTQNLIKNRKAQAAIEGAMQVAMAWAAAASQNYPAAVAHGVAAAMFFGVAGGAFKLPKGKQSDDKPKNDKVAGDVKRGDVHIHISGPIALTEAERGVMIRDALKAADREGM